MMQLVYKLKQSIASSIKLLYLNVKHSNDFGYLFSTTSFIRLVSAAAFAFVTFIFIEAIYGNINTLAGYSKNDMFVFMLIGQTAFGLNITLSFSNIEQFVRDINTGQLDMILSKPISHLLYISTKELDIFRFLQNFIPPILIFVYLINWQSTNITLVSAISSLVISCSGIILIHVFQFILGLYTFWSGNSTGLLDLSWVFEYNVGRVIPFDGFDLNFKIFFSTLIPVLVASGLSTSVLLGKVDCLAPFVISISLMLIALIIKSILWKFSLKHYTSASS